MKSSIRTMAEKFSRGIVLRRRLPPEFGRLPIYVSPEGGGLRYWRRNLRRADPQLLALATEFVALDSTIWDIGANVGLFTFAAAARSGPKGFILAVEPDVDNCRLLLLSHARALSARAPVAPVTVLSVAVHEPGMRFARFVVAARARASNALAGFGRSQVGAVREERDVVLVTLDELLDHYLEPRLIKIDVEGAEASILLGAKRLLESARPVLLIEVGSESRDAVRSILRAARYRILDGAKPPAERADLDTPPWNCIAIPVP